MDAKYVALKKMLIPNPNERPSAMRVAPGDIFSLDGSEGLCVDMLLRQVIIKKYIEPKPQKQGTKREEENNEPHKRSN